MVPKIKIPKHATLQHMSLKSKTDDPGLTSTVTELLKAVQA